MVRARLVLALALLPGAILRCLPGQDAVLAEGSGVRITEREYKDYLYQVFARARLEEMVLDRLLEKEAAALGLAVDQARIEADAKAALAHVLAEEYRGDEAAMRRGFAAQGYRPEDRLAAERFARRRSWLSQEILRKTRTVSDERLHARFDELYGVDGQKVEVRHLFVSFGTVREGLLKAGRRLEDIPAAEVEKAALARIEPLQEQLRQGRDFAELVREHSDEAEARALAADARTRDRAGRIEGYNYQHFGSELAVAVRALQPGQVSAPVKSLSGWHLIKLDSRVVTKLADVAEQVKAAVLADPPSLAEGYGLRARLLAKYPVERPLDAAGK
jgi:parvulin-like peptidyl-prolyl isomerase